MSILEENISRLTIAGIDVRISTGQSMRGTNLMGLDLTEVNVLLDEIDFTEACLAGATLTRIGLSNANFTKADLRGANLVEADLSGANLYGANLRGANLYGANFTYTRLKNANLAFADLRKAKNIGPPFASIGDDLSAILLWETILPDGTFFPGPYLTTGYLGDFPEEYR